MTPRARKRFARITLTTTAALLALVALFLGLVTPRTATAGPGPDPALAQVGWQQQLGTTLPLGLTFSDERGRVVALAHYFTPHRPVALVLMYLSCSRLCPLTLALTQQAFARTGLVPGRDFELLAVSIDPYDGVAAAARRTAALSTDTRWRSGLQLLTAAPSDRVRLHPASERLAHVVGFGFLPNAALAQAIGSPTRDQFVHPAGWVLIDPSGHINRYFFGLQYDPATLRQAVRDAAAQGRPTWSEPLRLLCDCLAVLTGRYDDQVLNLLRLLCVALLSVGGVWLWRQLAAATGHGQV